MTRAPFAGLAMLALPALAVLPLGACGSEPVVVLGQSPEVLWWTDHETGDTADWVRDAEGSTWLDSGGRLDVVTSPARSGRYALRSVVVPPASSALRSAAIAGRSGIMPVDAYYSAWYYIPAGVTTTSYWLFFKLRSRPVADDATSPSVDVWDLDFLTGSNGDMQFSLFGHAKGSNEPALTVLPVPIGRWFQVEAFLHATNDNTGRLTVWVDDTAIFDVRDRPTVPSLYIEWQVGGITGGITSPTATLYLDDAAISTRRLGTGFPIFWRGT